MRSQFRSLDRHLPPEEKHRGQDRRRLRCRLRQQAKRPEIDHDRSQDAKEQIQSPHRQLVSAPGGNQAQPVIIERSVPMAVDHRIPGTPRHLRKCQPLAGVCAAVQAEPDKIGDRQGSDIHPIRDRPQGSGEHVIGLVVAVRLGVDFSACQRQQACNQEGQNGGVFHARRSAARTHIASSQSASSTQYNESVGNRYRLFSKLDRKLLTSMTQMISTSTMLQSPICGTVSFRLRILVYSE